MHHIPCGHLHGFRMQPSGLAFRDEDHLEERLDFPRCRMMDFNSRFFLRCPGGLLALDLLLGADSVVNRNQLSDKVLEAIKFIHFALGIMEGGGRRKRFGLRFAIHPPGQTQLRIMARVVRFGAVASGLSAAPGDGADRTGRRSPRVKNCCNSSSLLTSQPGMGWDNGTSVLSVSIHSATCQSHVPRGKPIFMPHTLLISDAAQTTRFRVR